MLSSLLLIPNQIVLHSGNPRTVTYLLKLGANPLQENFSGETALQVAQHFFDNEEMIQVLQGPTERKRAETLALQKDPDCLNNNNLPNDLDENKPKKPSNWLSYATIDNALITALIALAGVYAWQKHTARHAEHA